ncbi:MAG: DUF6089 family protein [Bacteroidota bacterium]|nr:DUF6089 family protein [Bacteroidota bacterium]
MKRIIILLFFILGISFQGFSQGSEIGPFGGGSFYLGDINPDKLFYNTQPAFGLVYRKILNPRYAIKANLIYGALEADDQHSVNPIQKNRNLSFRTKIIDLSGQIEFNFLPYEIGDPRYPFSPYIFAGVSVFRFNPQANIDNAWVDLKPLSTEGQGTLASSGKSNYSLIQMAFPFGAGLKLALASRLGISLEWSLRTTTTDYLDDVSTTYPDLNLLASEKGPLAASLSDRSQNQGDLGQNSGLQRGNSKRNDWYSFAGIALTYKIGPKIPKCPAYK